jgi:hypothetical protein
MDSDTYVIDTSALINIHPDTYPHDIFEGMWHQMEKLIRDDRLISPKQVFDELKRKDDAIKKWVEGNKKLFRDLDPQQGSIVKDILKDYPNLIDAEKETDDADPFVIALALEKKTLKDYNKKIIVTDEKPKQNRDDIPAVCKKYGLECISLFDFLRREKIIWQSQKK